MTGRPGLPGLCILGTRYNDGVQGWGLRSKMSVLDRPYEGVGSSGDEMVEVLIVGLDARD